MKKYNEEHFTVRERRTHKKICDCGSFEDARMMMRLDGPNREIVKNKVMMAQVVDVEMPKALPTTNVVPSAPKEYLDSMYPEIPEDTVEPLVLPESQLQPLNL